MAQAVASDEYTTDDHLLPLDALAARLETALDLETPGASRGLDEAVAVTRLVTHGRNELPEPPRPSLILLFLKKFTDVFMVLLMLAGGLSFVAYGIDTTQKSNYIIGIILFGVVVLYCYMTFREEAKALTAMDSLRGMMASSCHVVRGGQERVMEPALLVPGDIVRLRLGERVPADVRVLLSRDLKTEQSSITGESDAVAANLDAISEEPLRAGNLLFASSLVVSGEGTALVTRTGKGTLVAGISLLAAGTTVPQRTILQKELDRVVRLMVLAAILCAALFLAIGLGRREPVGSVIANGVIIAIVVNVQQGLPATLGSCLAVASRRLAASNVLVRRADVVETLGAVTVICSDKTGTLTQNKLSLESVWVAGAAVPASALAQELRATLATPSIDWAKAPVAARLLAASALCNTATFGDDPEDSPPHTALELGEPDASKDAAAADAAPVDPVSSLVRTASEAVMPLFRAFSFTPAPPAPTPRGMHGSPLDVALLTYAASVTDVRRLRAGLPPIFVVPFNSAEKWAGVIVPFPGGGGATGPQHLALIKGGPELILARCSSYARPDGTTAPMDDAFRAACAAALATFGGRGERVVGAACSVLPGRPAAEYEADKDAFPLNGHTFLGLLSMADPPRPAVPAAVATLRRAGVRVTMITGDHALTAASIARQTGILTLPTREEVSATLGVPPERVPLGDPRVGALVLTGAQLAALTEDSEWDAVMAKKELVFARTSPAQKLRLVKEYQARNHVVAMTGDGVNDSPALKRADVGVAMGSPDASEVAREAADIILLDDDFSRLVAAVEEGRVLFDNLKKAITYTYSHLLPELLPAFLYLTFGLPPGLNGLLVLSVDLVTEQGPAISLAYEPAEEGVMTRPPRNLKKDRLVTAAAVRYAYGVAGFSSCVVCLGTYFLVFAYHGITPSMLAWSVDRGQFQAPPFSVRASDGATLGPTGRVVPDLVSTSGRVYGADKQYAFHREAMSAWFLCVVLTQFWNLWNVRTRAASAFTHGVRSNKVAIYGTGFAILYAIGVIYIPPFHSHDAFQTAFLHGYFWLPQLASCLFLFAYNETVKHFIRKAPRGFVAKNFGW